MFNQTSCSNISRGCYITRSLRSLGTELVSTSYSICLEHVIVILFSQMKSPSMTTVVNGNNKTLYMPNIPSIEQATKKNLKEKLTGMLSICCDGC